MFAWIALVVTSKYLNASHAEVRDQWSLGELTNYIHLHNGLAALEAAQHKKATRTLPRAPSL
jgi:hypothetical protein